MKRMMSLVMVFCLFFALPAVPCAISEETVEAALEVPAGMTVDSIGGFMYFVWDDWVMNEECSEPDTDYLSRTYVRCTEDDNSASFSVSLLEIANDIEGVTPENIFLGTLLVIAMMAADDEELQSLPLGFELFQIRGINGCFVTINNSVLWVGATETAMISAGFHDPALSAAEARTMLLEAIGASEPEPEPMEIGDPALYGIWVLDNILDTSGELLTDSVEAMDDLTGNMVWQVFSDGTLKMRIMMEGTSWVDMSGTYSIGEDGTLTTNCMGIADTYSYTVDGDILCLVRDGYTQVYSRKADE